MQNTHNMGTRCGKLTKEESCYDQNDVFTTQMLRVRITNERMVTDMITAAQKQFISKHVDSERYDVERLTKYLSMHDIVGAEVFHYCEKAKPNGRRTLSTYFEDDEAFLPMSIETFIRRIPFLFYSSKPNEKDELSNYGDILNILNSHFDLALENGDHYEPVFVELEHLYYDIHLPLEKIFSYWIDQSGNVGTKLFRQWAHYVRLIESRATPDFFPERFITAYNYALEEAGLPAIIYEIQDTGFAEPFIRSGDEFQFEGRFPCDEDGKPIMKWIGLNVTDAISISCNCTKSETGRLTIVVKPTTIIKALNFYSDRNDDEDFWYQLYAGPLNMDFDYEALQYFRTKLGYTQQQVADAVGTSVRTYQKWEAGSTIPNGFFLLKLLNWLDIRDIQDVVKYK